LTDRKNLVNRVIEPVSQCRQSSQLINQPTDLSVDRCVCLRVRSASTVARRLHLTLPTTVTCDGRTQRLDQALATSADRPSVRRRTSSTTCAPTMVSPLI